MTQADLARLRLSLEKKAVELSAELGRRNPPASPRKPDLADEAREASEHEQAARDPDRKEVQLRNVQMALERINNGNGFGVCLHCEQDIGLKRLAAIPWAPLCFRCQTAADLGDPEVKQTLKDMHGVSACLVH